MIYINAVIFAPIQQVVENLVSEKFSDIFHKIEEEENLLFNKINNEVLQLKSKSHDVNETNPHNSKKNGADMISSQQNRTVFTDGNSTSKSSTVSYSAAARQNKSQPKNSIIIRTRDANSTPDELYKEIKTSVNPVGLSVTVNSIKKTNNSVIINCGNSDSLNRLKDKLESQLGGSYDVAESKNISPKIIIFGTEKPETAVDDRIFEQNILKLNNISTESNNFQFKIVRRINHKGLINIIVAVDPRTRKAVIDKGYLYVEWKKCNVADSYHIKRCYNCSGFGHLNTECTKKFPVCSLCAEGHETRLCTSSSQKCANCIVSNKVYKTNLDINHCAKDKNCPTYLNKLNQIKEKTLACFSHSSE